MEAEIQKFKFKGKVYIWKYKDNERNYPGWNLTIDKTASDSLIELLSLMDNAEWSSKKTVPTNVPSALQLKGPNNQKGLAKWKSANHLVLNFRKHGPNEEWILTEKNKEVEIKFGKGKLIQLKKAIAEITQGKGDFAVSDSDGENTLYFWWNLEN